MRNRKYRKGSSDPSRLCEAADRDIKAQQGKAKKLNTRAKVVIAHLGLYQPNHFHGQQTADTLSEGVDV